MWNLEQCEMFSMFTANSRRKATQGRIGASAEKLCWPLCKVVTKPRIQWWTQTVAVMGHITRKASWIDGTNTRESFYVLWTTELGKCVAQGLWRPHNSIMKHWCWIWSCSICYLSCWISILLWSSLSLLFLDFFGGEGKEWAC